MSYIGSKRSSSLVSAAEITLDGAKLKSSGNSITKSDGTTAVLSESGGVVTLAHDIIDGNSSYGFCRLELTSNQTSNGEVTWNDPVGDTTNFTRSGTDITLGLSGVYLIIFNATCSGGSDERGTNILIRSSPSDTILARSLDQVAYLEGNVSHGFASVSYVGHFNANDAVNFVFGSYDNNTVDLENESHANIVLLRRTA